MTIEVRTTASAGGVLDPGLVETALDESELAQRSVAHPRRRGSLKREVWRAWMAVVVGAALWLGAAPTEAQTGSRPGAASSAEVQEAGRLERESIALYKAGKYD